MKYIEKRKLNYWVRNNLMFYSIITVLMAIIIGLLVWLGISQGQRLQEYNNYICQDIYGLDKDCK